MKKAFRDFDSRKAFFYWNVAFEGKGQEMETPKNTKKFSITGILKKIWQCIWNSGGSVSDCPTQPKSAQDYRDEALKKCPWYEQ